MQVHDKIKLLRNSHHLTQEDMAEKLEMSVNGYAKMERGGTNIQIEKLEQIANIFGIDVLELMSLGENKVIYCTVTDNENNGGVLIGVAEDESLTTTTKLQMTVNHQAEIIARQEKELETLKEMIALLKEKTN